MQALARFLSSPPKGVSVSTLQPKAQPDAPALAPTEEPAAPATAGSGLAALVDGKPCDIMDALTAAGAKCITIGGGYKGPHQRYTSDDLRAASELSNQVAVVKVPPPPKVTADLDDASRLDLLRRAYCATHEKVMRHAYWRPAKRQSEKERGAFLAACAALLEKDISPTAWAKFSFYQWQRTGRKTAPTPTWVWSVKRIALHSGWARTAVGTLASASASPLPATKALIERLALLRSKLGWGRPTDEVVSEVLPAKEREALLALQARQVATWKQNIERSIRNGEWVWG